MLSTNKPSQRYNYSKIGRYQSEPQISSDISITKPPTHGSYGGLLFDARWKDKRQKILARDNFQCIICNSDKDLQVHHRQYHYLKAIEKFKAPWDYDHDLLITLCIKCHQKGHSIYKIPIINI